MLCCASIPRVVNEPLNKFVIPNMRARGSRDPESRTASIQVVLDSGFRRNDTARNNPDLFKFLGEHSTLTRAALIIDVEKIQAPNQRLTTRPPQFAASPLASPQRASPAANWAATGLDAGQRFRGSC